MLPAGQRLRRREDFATAVRHGVRAARGAVVVHSFTETGPREDQPVRAGLVVGRVVGGAVVRNKVRRRLRHLLADRLGHLPAGTDVVVRALPEAAQRSYQELGADLDAALTAARTGRKVRVR